MPATQRALALIAVLLATLVLAGLRRHRLHRLSYGLIAYLTAVTIGDFLHAAWPERFFIWSFWLARETVYAVLKFMLALELAALIFSALPGAQRMAKRLAALVLGFTLAFILGAAIGGPAPQRQEADIILELQARLANGTSLLFAAIWAVVLWFRIPLHRWHRAILRGIVPYLVFFTFAAGLLPRLGPDRLAPIIGGLAYIAMLAYWSWEAWRPEPASEIPPAVLERLQPWRDRL